MTAAAGRLCRAHGSLWPCLCASRPWAGGRADCPLPAGSHAAIAAQPLGRREGEGGRAAPPQPLAPVAAGCACPALRAETARALARGRHVAALRPAGPHHGRAESGGRNQHHDLDARGGLALPAPWRGPCGGLAEGPPHGWTVRLVAITSAATREAVITGDQDGADLRVAPDGRVGRGVLHRGNGVHGAPTWGVLGIIQDQVNGLALAGMARAQPCLGLLAEHRLGVSPLTQAEVLDAGPVGRRVQRLIQGGDMPPSPPIREGEDPQAKVADMMPRTRPLQGVQTVVKAGGHAYDAEPGALRFTPPACGRWVRSFTRPGGWPLLPLRSSPRRQVPLKNRST
jgi:hypothetical protein